MVTWKKKDIWTVPTIAAEYPVIVLKIKTNYQRIWKAIDYVIGIKLKIEGTS